MNLTNMEPRARDTGHRVDTAAAVDPRGAVGQGRTCPGDTVGAEPVLSVVPGEEVKTGSSSG